MIGNSAVQPRLNRLCFTVIWVRLGRRSPASMSTHRRCLHGSCRLLGLSLPLVNENGACMRGATQVDPRSSHPGSALVVPHCATL